jgi:hypothetical protein
MGPGTPILISWPKASAQEDTVNRETIAKLSTILLGRFILNSSPLFLISNTKFFEACQYFSKGFLKGASGFGHPLKHKVQDREEAGSVPWSEINRMSRVSMAWIVSCLLKYQNAGFQISSRK